MSHRIEDCIDCSDIEELYDTLSSYQIAKLKGCSQPTIIAYLQRQNIPVRSLGEAREKHFVARFGSQYFATCKICSAAHTISKSMQLCKRCYSRLNARKYRKKDPVLFAAKAKAYRDNHRLELNATIGRWAKEHKLERVNSEARRRARKQQNGIEDFDLQDIVKRDKGICGICGKKVGKGDLCFDHIIPIFHGGAHIPSNVQVAHKFCNGSKGRGRIPSQTRLALEV